MDPLADEIDQLGDLGSAAHRFLGALPVLNLDALDVSHEPIPDEVVDEMAQALRAGLNEKGRRLSDARALSRLVPGRMALSGLGVPDAAMAVQSDYLDLRRAALICDLESP
jgi:hypothetical protein